MSAVCVDCQGAYVRLANSASGVLTDPYAVVWRDIVKRCGCLVRPAPNWVVVHRESGIALPVSECCVVDLASLPANLGNDDMDYFGDDESYVVQIAELFGLPLGDMIGTES